MVIIIKSLSIPTNQFLQKLLATQWLQFINISQIFELCLSTPISNAMFELHEITDWHYCLNKENLEVLLKVKVHDLDLLGFTKHYHDKALCLWWNHNERNS